MRGMVLALALAAPAPASAELRPGMSWYWQLSGELKAPAYAEVIDVDLFNTDRGTIDRLKRSGKTVICYFSAGTIETEGSKSWRRGTAGVQAVSRERCLEELSLPESRLGRPDNRRFPHEAVGNPMREWPKECWLDLRHPGVLAVMKGRLALAREKGCDGVEPDNVDGYDNEEGAGTRFRLTRADAVRFLKALSRDARAEGRLVGLKNAAAVVPDLFGDFDFAVVEECGEQGNCAAYRAFPDSGKPMFQAEYARFTPAWCAEARRLQSSLTFFKRALDGTPVDGDRPYRLCP
ncbi:MAG: endo alpha-1,4 polygalactosaminidase [Elusimicrobia bacterium]|nr:endo alpha-1,4 polygalactosaminidase [Elusimicrobiota bacterium]